MQRILYLLLLFLVVFSCGKKNEADNLFTFREFINYKTSGYISVEDPIRVGFSQSITKWDSVAPVPNDIITISPKVKGQIQMTSLEELVFVPDEPLKPDTEYQVTVKLKDIFSDVPKELQRYQFKIKTIKPSFIVVVQDLQSYDKDWQFVNGVVKLADVAQLDDVKKLVQAKQDKAKLSIKWDESRDKAKYFEFKIDSISRQVDDSSIELNWNGKPINANKIKGQSEIEIPGKNNFKVIAVNVAQSPEQVLSINFSDPLRKEQNFDGLIEIEGSEDLSFVVDGNVLKVYPDEKLIGNNMVEIFEGILSEDGYKLKENWEESVAFEELKPDVRILSGAGILPSSENLNLQFEAVNLKAIDVRIIKIYENNILQFLQDNDLGSSSERKIKRVGRKVAFKTIELIRDPVQNTGQWRAYSIDLSELFLADPGAIYRVELSYNKEYSLYTCDSETSSEEDEYYYEDDYYYEENGQDQSEEEREEEYWDNIRSSYKRYTYNWRERDNPCHEAYYNDREVSCNLIGSNLGVIAKQGKNKTYSFAVTNILTTDPEAGAKVELFNFQQQSLAQQQTDSRGFVNFKLDNNAYFAVVSKQNNTTYLKLDEGNALSMSKYDVSGQTLSKGLKGYIYGERGVWRPGDTLHLTFILNDKDNPLPPNHPVALEVTNTQGKLVFKEVVKNAMNGFYKFTVPTSDDDPTGRWQAAVSVGGAKFYKGLKIETVKPNRLKMQLEFDDEILTGSLDGALQVNWLHGAPAKNVKAEILANIYRASTNFQGFDNYVFHDPTRSFSSEEQVVFEGEVDENGYASIDESISIEEEAPGMLSIGMLIRAFEPGGGFSITSTTKKYAPYESFVGLRKPDGDGWGELTTNQNHTFDVAVLDPEGNPVRRNELEVEVHKIEWRWWWSSSYNDLSSYRSSEYHDMVFSETISTNSSGKGSFKINIPDDEGGRYLVRVYDPASGHAAGQTVYFYRNWWDADFGDSKDASTMLVFQTDKNKYEVGEEAKITFPSGSSGRALLSIENGTEVISSSWVKTQQGETTATIPITKEMAPNAFINISLLQPHNVMENDLPIRLYGVIPLMVEDKSTILRPQISMPDVLRPEQTVEVTVSEKNKQPMTYTIAVVDEGLLDLTRFKTPNAWDAFYAREALGVKTFDMFDEVIGAYTGSVDQTFAIGGGEIGNDENSKKANRFKPVVTYLGPFELKPNQKQKHKITIPKYIGSVRTMVIAGNAEKEAYGSAEKATPVRQPLMALATLPRKLSPGEKVTLPVTIFAMENKIKNVDVKLKLSDGIQIIGENLQSLSFSKPDEKMAYFDLDVSQARGVQNIEVIATGNGEKSSYEVEIDVFNPNPYSTQIEELELEANSSQRIDFSTFGELGTNSAKIEFSTLPPINLGGRLDYLIRYPHGCVEQTTSTGFPQLFLGDILDITAQQKQEINQNIKKTIKRLGKFQRPNGGMSYWIGEPRADDWGTSYAGHFLLEAEKKGYTLPLTFKSNWIRYQKEASRAWRPGRYGQLAQAYRLYTLALAGEADLSAMNRLRQQDELSNDTKWRLAAAYALAGQDGAAKSLANSANINFEPKRYDYYTYGDVFRNRAMALETMSIIDHNQKNELVKQVANTLSSERWLSTQTTAYSLLAMSKFVKENGGKSFKMNYSLNNAKAETIDSKSAIALRDLGIKEGANQVELNNQGESNLFVRVFTTGKLPLGQEIADSRGLSVEVRFMDLFDNPMDISNLTQGQDFVASITVKNTTDDYVPNIALSQIFPSGWEIVNTRFTELNATIGSQARYTDIRDDRVNFYFDLQGGKAKRFAVNLNAAYLGKYYLPGTQAEAMYDNDYFVRNQGKWIEVVK